MRAWSDVLSRILSITSSALPASVSSLFCVDISSFDFVSNASLWYASPVDFFLQPRMKRLGLRGSNLFHICIGTKDSSISA